MITVTGNQGSPCYPLPYSVVTGLLCISAHWNSSFTKAMVCLVLPTAVCLTLNVWHGVLNDREC